MGKALLELGSVNKRALLAILCMQQRFECLYNHIITNRNNLDSEFFGQLASLTSADKTEKWLKGKGISYRKDEDENLQDFLKCFIKVLTSNPEADAISKDEWNRVQELLQYLGTVPCLTVLVCQSKCQRPLSYY